MRAMWTGQLSWGMVVIPVKLGKAASEDAVTLHMVHKEDGGRIRFSRECNTCGRPVTADEIGKGAELATGETVQLTDEELAALPLATLKTVEVLYFCQAAEVDPVSWDGSYYLWPNGASGTRAYRLLAEALAATGKVAVCKIAMRQRESLAMVASRGGVLTLVTLYWPGEVKQPDFLPELEAAPAPVAAERKMAATLIDAGTKPFNPDEHHDRYSEAVRALVDSKHGVAPVSTAPDLTSALQASLDAAKPLKTRAPRRKRAAAGDEAK